MPLCRLVKTAMVKLKEKNKIAKMPVKRAIGFLDDCAERIFDKVSAALLVNELASGRCKKIHATMRTVTRIKIPVKISTTIPLQYNNLRCKRQALTFARWFSLC